MRRIAFYLEPFLLGLAIPLLLVGLGLELWVRGVRDPNEIVLWVRHVRVPASAGRWLGTPVLLTVAAAAVLCAVCVIWLRLRLSGPDAERAIRVAFHDDYADHPLLFLGWFEWLAVLYAPVAVVLLWVAGWCVSEARVPPVPPIRAQAPPPTKDGGVGPQEIGKRWWDELRLEQEAGRAKELAEATGTRWVAGGSAALGGSVFALYAILLCAVRRAGHGQSSEAG